MLKVFEAFAGYGSQRMALENIGINYEVVGISEVDEGAILSYSAIHNDLKKKLDEFPIIDGQEMVEYLEQINVPLDYRTFKNKACSLKGDRLRRQYIANKISNNFGDIRKIDPKKLPDFDFFTYSFPCQDISVAGYQKGLDNGSGTRSSLLWECIKIIKEKRPKYLMMENVKNLVGQKHLKNFENFLDILEKLGYTNYWDVLNSKDYNIPQSRSRVFCISILGGNEKQYTFPEEEELTLKIEDLLEDNPDKRFYLKNNQVTSSPIKQKYIYCLDSNYWKGTFLKDFLKSRRRQLVSGEKDENGNYPSRRLTPKETWRFMGVKDEDFEKAAFFNSNTNLYRQSGNSIVVPVLEKIFINLFIVGREKMNAKKKLIEIFHQNVKGKIPDVSYSNQRHDGRIGHWLERQFNIAANGNNEADIFGYELKNQTTSKTTFGDWSPNYFIFKDEGYFNIFDGGSAPSRQDQFVRMFGKPNEEKGGRCSWSGQPAPRLNQYNDFGQIMYIEDNFDIVVAYCYSEDRRDDKSFIIPDEFKVENLEIARWYGYPNGLRGKSLSEKLEDKFNQNGWFTCKTNSYGVYEKICFGNPITFENWMKLVQEGTVFFDPGMYEGNKRPYCQWRANNNLWNSLITEEYD